MKAAISDKRIVWPAYAAVVVFLSAVYFAGVRDLGLDVHDAQTFRDNAAIAQDWGFYFSPEKEQRTGRPLADLVKYLAYVVWGNSPQAFHLLVVAAHTLSSILLGVVACLLNAGRWTAMTGGLLFLVNVSHFQAVHHISALDYPLGLLLMLFGLLCYERRLSGGRGWWWGTYAGVLLAPLAHASTAFVWPVFPLFALVRSGRSALRPLLPLLGLLTLEMVLVVAFMPETTSTGRAFDLFAAGDFLDLMSGIAFSALWLSGRLLTTAHWIGVPLYERVFLDPYIGAGVGLVLAVLVFRMRAPASIWAAWSLLALTPFLLMSHDPVLNDRVWASTRYLYAASAGTSVLLALALARAGRYLGTWGPWFQGGATAALLVSSYLALKQAEGLSLFSSGRNYVARGDYATGIAQLKRAIHQGPDAIDLEFTYAHVCFLTIGDRGHRFFLRQALDAYPTHPLLNLLWPVVRSMDADSTIATPPWNRLKLLRDSSPETRIQLSPGVWVLASNAKRDVAAAYHKVGNGFRSEGDFDRAVLAYSRSLMFRPDRVQTKQALAELRERGRP